MLDDVVRTKVPTSLLLLGVNKNGEFVRSPWTTLVKAHMSTNLTLQISLSTVIFNLGFSCCHVSMANKQSIGSLNKERLNTSEPVKLGKARRWSDAQVKRLIRLYYRRKTPFVGQPMLCRFASTVSG